MKKLFILSLLFFILFGHAFSQTPFTVLNLTDSIIVKDPSNSNKIILRLKKSTVWSPFAGWQQPLYASASAPQLSVVTQTDGFDLEYIFTSLNPTDTLGLGNFYFDKLYFDSVVTFHDIEFANGYQGANKVTNTHGVYKTMNNYWYPGYYSPVQMISNPQYNFGLSLLFPALIYKDFVYMSTRGGGSGGDWAFPYEINSRSYQNIGLYSKEGNLLPLQSKKFTFTFRFSRTSDPCKHWILTSKPYKNYFRNLYGMPQYQRDPRPVGGIVPADVAYTTTNVINTNTANVNRYGWKPLAPNIQPDLFGFGPLTNYMYNNIISPNNYKRFMMWSPTGVYKKAGSINYPNKFTSHWLEGNNVLFPHSYGHNMGDAMDSLKKIPNKGIDFGLYWGYASTIHFFWDTVQTSSFDIFNPAHRAHQLKEIDLAAQTGAKEIGLDAFPLNMPLWYAMRWIDTMKFYHPQLRFTSEQGSTDILHTKTGFMYFHRYTANRPHYMANYLLPGNEIWSIVDTLSVDTIATKGFVPIAFSYTPVTPAQNAAPTWFQTNPEPDLGPDITMLSGDSVIFNGSHMGAISFLWSSAATTNTIVVKTSGVYWVQTTTGAGCIFSDTVKVNVLPVAGIRKNTLVKDILVYPNPANDKVTIDLKETFAKMIEILDINGKKILSFNSSAEKNTFSVETFLTGIYFYRIIGKDNELLKSGKFAVLK